MTLDEMLRESTRDFVTPTVAPPPFAAVIQRRRQRHRNTAAALVCVVAVAVTALFVVRSGHDDAARITTPPASTLEHPSNQVVQRDFTLQRDGFVGRFFAPKSGINGPPVLVIDDSAGLGFSAATAQTLASRGIPAMAVAFYQWPGLPDQINSIPLEYFVPAIDALRHQPEVDAERIAVLGTSRGSEAALLLGAHYPELVSAVAALSPSNVAGCGAPNCEGAHWTFEGAPVPSATQQDPQAPAAEIPVEQIQAPIFLACGLLDTIWRACSMANDIQTRLDNHGFSYPVRVIEKYRAGHIIQRPPDDPPARGGSEISIFGGGTYADNQKAQRSTWSALVRWLQSNK